jgi:AKAP7 2'5' RNA ligase-like domain
LSSLQPGPRQREGPSTSEGKKRLRPVWTHFMSVPLNGPAEQAAFAKLKGAMLQCCPDVISDAAFTRAVKWHVTLGMVALPADDDVEKARTALAEALPALQKRAAAIGESKELEVTMAAGLATFEDRDVTRARVIFRRLTNSAAKVAIEQMAADLTSTFERAGITCSPMSDLQLHATVVNVKYAAKGRRRANAIDATAVLESFRELCRRCTCLL